MISCFFIVPLLLSLGLFIFKEFGIPTCLPKKGDGWILESLAGLRFKGKAKVLWRCAVKAVLRTTWKERNQRGFEDSYSSERILLWIVFGT